MIASTLEEGSTTHVFSPFSLSLRPHGSRRRARGGEEARRSQHVGVQVCAATCTAARILTRVSTGSSIGIAAKKMKLNSVTFTLLSCFMFCFVFLAVHVLICVCVYVYVYVCRCW